MNYITEHPTGVSREHPVEVGIDISSEYDAYASNTDSSNASPNTDASISFIGDVGLRTDVSSKVNSQLTSRIMSNNARPGSVRAFKTDPQIAPFVQANARFEQDVAGAEALLEIDKAERNQDLAAIESMTVSELRRDCVVLKGRTDLIQRYQIRMPIQTWWLEKGD